MSSVGTQRNTFRDISGRITVAVFTHTSGTAQEHFTEQEILVGDGEMVAIGGGGTGSDSPAGNMLTASHPNDDLSGWVVSSKDHEIPDAVALQTHVIGLKIAGMSRDELLNSIFVGQADSGQSAHPEAEAGVPNADFVLVGGGFRVDSRGAGSLATASFPSTEFSWKARSKDHDISDPSNIRTYAMCMRRDLRVGRISAAIDRADSDQTNHPQATVSMRPGFALTGGGADVHFRGAGSLLYNLRPSTDATPSFTAASKDHRIADPSVLTAFALGIRLEPSIRAISKLNRDRAQTFLKVGP